MNETIPPSDDRGRAKLERKADTLLEAAEDESWESWSDFWPSQEATEFDRIAAAHTGMIPLMAVPLVVALPDFDPDADHRAIQSLMQERPGAETPDTVSQILDESPDSTAYGSGFTVERRNFPPEVCRWSGCNEPLYAAGPRRAGRPRMHCTAHPKAARARTQRLRRAGIHGGRNRNLVYDSDGLAEQDLAGYRQLWGRINTAST